MRAADLWYYVPMTKFIVKVPELSWGYHTVIAETSEEAIEKVKNNQTIDWDPGDLIDLHFDLGHYPVEVRAAESRVLDFKRKE